MCRLNHMYMATDASPFPRPIMCHWPRRWPRLGLEASPILGHVKDLPVSPHFCQPNSIEFDEALQWRRLRAVEQKLKQETNEEHILQLTEVLCQGCKVCPKPCAHSSIKSLPLFDKGTLAENPCLEPSHSETSVICDLYNLSS